MRYYVLFIVFVLTALASATPVQTLESLVGQWVDLRGAADQEQREWTLQSVQWRREMDLLREADMSLDTSLTSLEADEALWQQRSAGLMEHRDRLKSVLEQVDRMLVQIQPRLDALVSFVPPVLKDGVLSFASIPGDRAATVVERLPIVMDVIRGLETLQDGVHATRMMIALEGAPRREMDVVFLGLARGYAVTMDDRVAAVGYPGASGWQWVPLPGAAPAIRQLVRVARQDTPPRLVSIPVAGHVPVGVSQSTGQLFSGAAAGVPGEDAP